MNKKVIVSLAVGTLLLVACGPGVNNDQPFKDPPASAPAQQKVSYPEPDPDNFTLTPKILEKKCFGLAGCNVTFRVEVSYDGPKLDPTRTYELTYEVKGGEDQFIGTLTVTGTQYSTRDEQFIGTETEAAELKMVILEVE